MLDRESRDSDIDTVWVGSGKAGSKAVGSPAGGVGAPLIRGCSSLVSVIVALGGDECRSIASGGHR